MSKTYTLSMDAYSPRTIPMARLAEYLRAFAELMGHTGAVHFDGVRPGSTQFVARVDHEDVPKVRDRLLRLRRGEAAPEAKRAEAALDRLLAADNASGFLYEDDDAGTEIVRFPGATRPKPASYGPFNQEGTLDGTLISVGGADQSVHLQLQNGDLKYTGLETDRDTACRLARHMFEPVRVSGTGRWFRDESGRWELRRFRVDGFVVLRNDDLRDAAGELRAIPGSDWRTAPGVSRAKVKFDRQIVAIAVAEGAHTVYSDDDHVIRYARQSGLKAVRTDELDLPPDDTQGVLSLSHRRPPSPALAVRKPAPRATGRAMTRSVGRASPIDFASSKIPGSYHGIRCRRLMRGRAIEADGPASVPSPAPTFSTNRTR